MKRLVIYIHGKGGSSDESEYYKPLFPEADVIGLDYYAQNPWEAKKEFSDYYDLKSKGYDSVIVIANSIGAFFTMIALSEKKIEKEFFISPIVDMKRLIQDMMQWAGVTKEELQRKKIIHTDFGETLSWEYYSYVCNHPIVWKIPTSILYGEKDHFTSLETISNFADDIGASLTVMSNGEHWFHTEEQMRFLEQWCKSSFAPDIISTSVYTVVNGIKRR